MNRLLFFLMLASITLCGCGGGSAPVPSKKHGESRALEASAYREHAGLINQNGKNIGYIEVKESDDEGSDIHISADHLPPGASLGFHIYEKGVCQTPDFESAGGPFNPLNKEHGFNNPMGHHAGDLPNLEVGADGKVDVIMNAPQTSLKEGSRLSLLDRDGSAFIIHEHTDDYLTNPSGNSGARIACAPLKKSARRE
ncbi:MULTISPECIES: superoxide dismutase family protein [Bacillus amyloliquefaciens group]|uniref:superoxide dismutase family protein n=1 Tax=Bacillus amyloliquefaciens group TaxID=1938374 RepID=UPI000B518188|nr:MULTISPECIES: superoxide dismutase family protein [Bacillus amyloliquefaciens group]ASF29094.1 superoxide dismutase [Bacillus amyloliquefaciens]MDQ8091538.1 superoxide dismutase family protein [Bacillus amyloliquefaciens]